MARRMETSRQGDVTGLLVAWKNGSPEALDELIPIVYAELRKLERKPLRPIAIHGLPLPGRGREMSRPNAGTESNPRG